MRWGLAYKRRNISTTRPLLSKVFLPLYLCKRWTHCLYTSVIKKNWNIWVHRFGLIKNGRRKKTWCQCCFFEENASCALIFSQPALRHGERCSPLFWSLSSWESSRRRSRASHALSSWCMAIKCKINWPRDTTHAQQAIQHEAELIHQSCYLVPWVFPGLSHVGRKAICQYAAACGFSGFSEHPRCVICRH